MKTITHYKTAKDKTLHIETELGIVNIRVGLENSEGQEVTSIEILPDQYTEEEVQLDGSINNRLIRVK